MSAATTTTSTPSMTCGGCKARLDLSGKKVGDSITCGCGRLEVVTRLKIEEGSLPPAKIMGQLGAGERKEVDAALHRIKMRRVGHAARNVELYPTWALVLAIGQFWLTGIMAGHNLAATGQPERGARVRALGIVLYVLLNASILIAALAFWDKISPLVAGPVMVAIPLLYGGYAVWSQGQTSRAAREAGARRAGLVLPFLLGLMVAIAQAFLALFLSSRLSSGF